MEEINAYTLWDSKYVMNANGKMTPVHSKKIGCTQTCNVTLNTVLSPSVNIIPGEGPIILMEDIIVQFRVVYKHILFWKKPTRIRRNLLLNTLMSLNSLKLIHPIQKYVACRLHIFIKNYICILCKVPVHAILYITYTALLTRKGEETLLFLKIYVRVKL